MPKSALRPSELCPGPRAVCGGTGLGTSTAGEEEGIFGWGCSHIMKSWPLCTNGGMHTLPAEVASFINWSDKVEKTQSLALQALPSV